MAAEPIHPTTNGTANGNEELLHSEVDVLVIGAGPAGVMYASSFLCALPIELIPPPGPPTSLRATTLKAFQFASSTSGAERSIMVSSSCGGGEGGAS